MIRLLVSTPFWNPSWPEHADQNLAVRLQRQGFHDEVGANRAHEAFEHRNVGARPGSKLASQLPSGLRRAMFRRAHPAKDAKPPPTMIL